MFVDVKIGFTNAELKECQELLAYLSNTPGIKAEVATDKMLQEANAPAGQDGTEHVVEEATVTAEEASTDKPATTLADLRAMAKEYMDKHGVETFSQLLADMGYQKISQMKPEDYDKMAEAIKNAG